VEYFDCEMVVRSVCDFTYASANFSSPFVVTMNSFNCREQSLCIFPESILRVDAISSHSFEYHFNLVEMVILGCMDSSVLINELRMWNL